MLVFRRYDRPEQWIEVTHADSGDSFRFRVYDIRPGHPGQASVALDDDEKLFEFNRSERVSVANA